MNIQDVWKHISNKVANKVSNPFDDLYAAIIPIDENGEFTEVISSMDGYEGDSYTLIIGLIHDTDKLPTANFAYYCPGRKRNVETGEVESHSIIFALVNGHENVVFGMWELETNKVEYFEEDSNQEFGGELPIALASLALKKQIDSDQMGEIGKLMKESLQLAEASKNKVMEVLNLQAKENSE